MKAKLDSQIIEEVSKMKKEGIFHEWLGKPIIMQEERDVLISPQEGYEIHRLYIPKNATPGTIKSFGAESYILASFEIQNRKYVVYKKFISKFKEGDVIK